VRRLSKVSINALNLNLGSETKKSIRSIYWRSRSGQAPETISVQDERRSEERRRVETELRRVYKILGMRNSHAAACGWSKEGDRETEREREEGLWRQSQMCRP